MAMKSPVSFLRQDERRVRLLPVAIVALVAIAYHYSLLSLARGLTLQTPLAYIALVPPIALLLAWVRWRQIIPGLQPRELVLDYPLSRLLGVAMIGAALVVSLLVPLSVRFWLFRVDLLGLPLFVAGLVTIAYGVRRLWLLRLPIAFLLLAWPVPYLPLVGQLMTGFTDATIAAVAVLNRVVPLAEVGSDGVFFVTHAGHAFPLVVGSACAGVNGLVGFFLVGSALSVVVTGPLARRLLWLAVGLGIMWGLNVVRIEAIFAVGLGFGRDAALNVLHPAAGLLTFNIGVLLMLAAVPRFGLRFVELPKYRAQESVTPALPAPRHLALLGIALVAAVLLGAVNANYARYEAIASGLGTPRIGGLDTSVSHAEGWSADFVANFDGARQFYGESATWRRVQYNAGPQASLTADRPIYVDVIATDDWQALNAYGLEACYRFHGYTIESQYQADLPGGVTATVVHYRNPKAALDWSAVWWEWPAQNDGQVRYERVVVFLANGAGAVFRGSDPTAAVPDGMFADTGAFLITLARSIVSHHLSLVDDETGMTEAPAWN
jgi:exosortase